jgi:hypothetical protein
MPSKTINPELLTCERRQRTTKYLEAANMRPFDQLLVAGDNFVWGAHDSVRFDRRARPADIVDPDQNDDMRNGRQTQDVTLEAGESTDAGAVAEYTISGDALIQNRQRYAGVLQPSREHVGPIGIHGRGGTIGN